MSGDLLHRLMSQAEMDEARYLEDRRKETRQPFTMRAISDAAAKAIPLYARAMIEGGTVIEGAADRRRPVDHLRMNFDIVLHQFSQRIVTWGLEHEEAQRRVNMALADIEKARPVCESYIEEILMPWLVFEDYGQITEGPIPVHMPKAEDLPPSRPLILVPQFAFAKYRMDFALVYRKDLASKIVCIECDGAAFHANKSKDITRDAYLAEWGIPTVRIDAREVREYPRRASQRCARMISDLVG